MEKSNPRSTNSALKKWLDAFLNEPMPEGVGWRHIFGSILLFLVIVQFITGILLALYYSPATATAYQSVQYIDEQVLAGKLIRGIHHWSASAFVIVIVLHILRTFLYAAYKKPRQATWIAGVTMLLVVLGFAFTGYLLPWDMKAYFATRVGIEVGASAPVLGPMLAKLLKGGAELGALTLTRFYTLHVIVLPLILLFVLGIHLLFVRTHKITPPWKRNDEPATYSGPFFPSQMARDSVAVLLVLALILAVAQRIGAPLEAPADPMDTAYVPRPDWYFYGLYQLLRIFQGPYEIIGTIILPTAFILTLFALPFVDRNPERALGKRRFAVTGGVLTFFVIVTLTVWGGYEGTREVAAAKEKQMLAETQPPIEKSLADPEMGRRLFEGLKCASCHDRPSEGVNIPPGLEFSGSKYQPRWLADYLQNPYRIRWLDTDERPVERMPDFFLSRQEAMALAAYLMQQTDSTKIGATRITWQPADSLAIAHGRALVNDYACTGCHLIDGEGAQVGPDLRHVGSKLQPNYMYRLLLKPQMIIPKTPMKDNALWDDEAEAIVRYLQSLKHDQKP
ncbi:MAG: cytochrome b N-terminal domain-containing protein [bacterium]